MLRTNTCGELGAKSIGKEVTLCGWVQKSRDLGGMTFRFKRPVRNYPIGFQHGAQRRIVQKCP